MRDKSKNFIVFSGIDILCVEVIYLLFICVVCLGVFLGSSILLLVEEDEGWFYGDDFINFLFIRKEFCLGVE